MLDGELHWLTGDVVPEDGRTDVRRRSRHSARPRCCSSASRSSTTSRGTWTATSRTCSAAWPTRAEADALLEAEGHGALRLVDNGAIVAPMPGIPRPHAYHLIPRAASKARAVAFHMRARGYAPEECIAVGDSREDIGAAAAVGTFWLVANGAADATGVANVRRCEGANGAGVYEAVLTELAERR